MCVGPHSLFSPLITLDHLLRPSSPDLHPTEGYTSQNIFPLSLQIGKRNGNTIHSSTFPSRSFLSTSLKTRSPATICGNWLRSRTARSVIRTSLRFKSLTRSSSSLSFSTARRLLSRMSRFSCLEIYSNSSWPGGTRRRRAESRKRS